MKIPGLDGIAEQLEELPGKTDEMLQALLRVEGLLVELVEEVKKRDDL